MADLVITADQLRIGCAAIGWSEQDLADAAGVPIDAVIGLQTGASEDAAASRKILFALESAGVSFFQAPDGTSRMRARTLDGIIEAPVTMTSRR